MYMWILHEKCFSNQLKTKCRTSKRIFRSICNIIRMKNYRFFIGFTVRFIAMFFFYYTRGQQKWVQVKNTHVIHIIQYINNEDKIVDKLLLSSKLYQTICNKFFGWYRFFLSIKMRCICGDIRLRSVSLFVTLIVCDTIHVLLSVRYYNMLH